MFDVLGVISFLFVVYCIVMCIVSMFSRRTNRKLWIAALIGGLVIFFASYGLDMKFDKEPPVEIDFSDVELETPTPEPTASPEPDVSAAPEEAPEEINAEADISTTPEVTGEPDNAEPSPEETPEAPAEPEVPEAETPAEEPEPDAEQEAE